MADTARGLRRDVSALRDVAVILDTEVGEMSAVTVADTIDDKLVPGNIVEALRAPTVMQRFILLAVKIDRKFHRIRKLKFGQSAVQPVEAE